MTAGRFPETNVVAPPEQLGGRLSRHMWRAQWHVAPVPPPPRINSSRKLNSSLKRTKPSRSGDLSCWHRSTSNINASTENNIVTKHKTWNEIKDIAVAWSSITQYSGSVVTFGACKMFVMPTLVISGWPTCRWHWWLPCLSGNCHGNGEDENTWPIGVPLKS